MNPSIIICGGSLAGLSAALHLKQLGYAPLVLEKTKFPRAKLCGEFLGPDAFPILAALGVLNRVLQASRAHIQNALFYSTHNQVLKIPLRWIQPHYPFALAIPRIKLDFCLQQAAKDFNIDIWEETQVLPAIHWRDQQFIFQVRHQQNLIDLKADLLIDASGRNSGLRLDGETVEQSPVKTLGLQCHLHCKTIEDDDLRMFLFPSGYGGLQRIEPDVVNLCLLLTQPTLKNYASFRGVVQETLAQNPTAAKLLKEAIPIDGWRTTANLKYKASSSRLIQIGDAHLNVDPITGTGMAHALETGYLLACAIHQGIQHGEAYAAIRKRYQQIYQRKYALRLQLLRTFRPLLFSTRLQELTWPALRIVSRPMAQWFR